MKVPAVSGIPAAKHLWRILAIATALVFTYATVLAKLANLEAELQLVDGEAKRQQVMFGEIDGQISVVMVRINNVPGVEVALGALDRDYETKKAQYDALLIQAQRNGLSADATSQQQGEGIQVIDPANLPARPVAPKRLVLIGAGAAAGLAFGLRLAGLFEVPRLLTIQTSEDATHYTSLPVPMTVPELLTPGEAQSIPRRRKLLLATAVAAMFLAIPATDADSKAEPRRLSASLFKNKLEVM